MKTCTKCGAAKPESEFFVRDKKVGRLHAQCKTCYREHRKTYHKQHYEKYGDLYRTRAVQRRRLMKQELRNNMLAYMKGKSCEICGEADIRTLDFDHIDPSAKSFGIAKGITTYQPWELILNEIQKCRILCANCHRKHTASQQGWYKNFVN